MQSVSQLEGSAMSRNPLVAHACPYRWENTCTSNKNRINMNILKVGRPKFVDLFVKHLFQYLGPRDIQEAILSLATRVNHWFVEIWATSQFCKWDTEPRFTKFVTWNPMWNHQLQHLFHKIVGGWNTSMFFRLGLNHLESVTFSAKDCPKMGKGRWSSVVSLSGLQTSCWCFLSERNHDFWIGQNC